MHDSGCFGINATLTSSYVQLSQKQLLWAGGEKGLRAGLHVLTPEPELQEEVKEKSKPSKILRVYDFMWQRQSQMEQEKQWEMDKETQRNDQAKDPKELNPTIN